MDAGTEISAAARHFLERFAAHDVEALGACYTEDAQMLVANMRPIRGRAAIESVFKFTGGRGHRLEFQALERELHGDTAVEMGRYVRTHCDGRLFDEGKYIVIWKHVNGRWKIHRDMFSTDLARTPAFASA